MSNFATNLRLHLLAMSDRTYQEDRILAMLDEPDGPRHRRQLRRMETRCRHEAGYSSSEGIDWSSIDWAKVLQIFIKVLLTLLPLLLAEKDE